MTANTVMASEPRLIEVLHFCFRRHRIAEIRVPACPIPIQNTKLTIAHPQLTGLLFPHSPTPEETRTSKPIPVKLAIEREKMKHHHHQAGGFASTIPQILSVIQCRLRLFSTSGTSSSLAGLTFFRISGDGFTVSVVAELINGENSH